MLEYYRSLLYSLGMRSCSNKTIEHVSFVGTCLNTPPRRNLGPRWNGVDDETLFADAFVAAYDTKYAWLHSGSTRLNRAMAREVPVNGFGIADLVTVSSDLPMHDWFVTKLCPTVRAFEFKLSDWRRGMMQAHRYRFFADASILVIPAKKLHLATNALQTFKKINVGLWGFDQMTDTIQMLFTPRPRLPADIEHREKAISLVFESTMQDLLAP